jgi:Flagellar motor switch protein
VGAYLDARALPLSALTGLDVGQILQLPLDARTSVTLAADGRVLFRGEIGQDGGHYSVRVAEAVRDAPRSSQLAAHRFPQFERLEA